MNSNLENIYKQALDLPDESKVELAERLVDYIGNHIDPQLEKQHIEIVTKRKQELKNKEVKPIDGEFALMKIREIIHT